MTRTDTRVIHMEHPDPLMMTMDWSGAPAITGHIADTIRDRMAEQGLSQRDLSDAALIPLATLSRRLNAGGKTFDMAELAAIARVLGTTVTDIIRTAETRGAAA